ncbi:secondary thiamine-phosphate synthase enzyme YjbQ [bacterium]|nr:secondary thiamine-phosphate synthase enzyme YjbQ [bacterium]
MIESFRVTTRSRSELIDITDQVRDIVSSAGIKNGVCQVFIPHTTAGITINENADPDVKFDILASLDQIVPWRNNYRHSEGNSAAHIKASLMGFSVFIPIDDGKLVLGTWQCVYFCEFDGPRTRKAVVNITGH